jgi:nucleotide-binding universal stress UspA family protein
MKSLSETSAVRLTEEAGRLRKLGAMVKEKLHHGLPDEKLVELSRAPGARMVVVSSLGHRPAGRWLLGSISERTAESAAVPTLVVRDAAPFEAWAAGTRKLKVLVALDFTQSAEAALRWVKELKKIGPCEIIAAHISWPPGELARLGPSGVGSLAENPTELQQALERDLSATVREVLGDAGARVRIMSNWGRVDFALIEIARQENADLIVTGTHRRHGLQRLAGQSVSRGLLHYAPMSVACVPTPTATVRKDIVLPRIHRALAATDFSPLGDRAVPYAYASLAERGVVKLIHVVPPWGLPGPFVPHYQNEPLTKKKHNQLIADSLKKLRALIPAEADALGIVTEVEVVHGRNPAEIISQTAEGFGADLICIGTHGRSGLSAALLGSVATGFMTMSKRPVLTVRGLED